MNPAFKVQILLFPCSDDWMFVCLYIRLKNKPALRLNLLVIIADICCRKNLINQEAKFQSQLNDLSKQLSVRDAEANKLRFQMEELQRDVFAKSAGIDREFLC